MSGISRKLLAGESDPPRETISVVGSTTDTTFSTLSFSGITGLAEGDLVVVWLVDNGSAFNVTSSGWSSWVGTFPSSANNVSIRNMACYKVMGATPDTGITVSTGIDCGIAIAFRGAEATPTTNTFQADSNNVDSIDPNTVFIQTDGSVVVQFAGIDDHNATITPSTGFTALTAGYAFVTASLCYKLDVDKPSIDPDTISWSEFDTVMVRQAAFEPSLL